MIFIIIITILAILAVVSACVVALINAKEREQQASEFRGIYGLADDTVIYYSSGVSAVSPMNPTKHEGILAKQVIDMGFFNRYSVFWTTISGMIKEKPDRLIYWVLESMAYLFSSQKILVDGSLAMATNTNGLRHWEGKNIAFTIR